MTKRFSKRFEALATELRHNPFFRARLKLATSTIILPICGAILFYFIDNPYLYISVAICIAIIAYFISLFALRQIRNFMRSQKRFIADVSHELRTPISIIKTNSEIALLNEANTPPEITEILKSTVSEIDRMSKMLKNLLNLEQYDKETHELPMHSINPGEILSRITENMRPLALKSGITLAAENHAPHTHIRGNTTAIEELITNLLTNAIKFTKSGGTITSSITLDHKEKIVTLFVQDTGIGIPADKITRVFEPFFKYEYPAIGNRQKGIGLGLAIVREIVKLHHGTIAIESASNKGTRVTVRFPTI